MVTIELIASAPSTAPAHPRPGGEGSARGARTSAQRRVLVYGGALEGFDFGGAEVVGHKTDSVVLRREKEGADGR